jgi:hypothetical protein
MGFIPLFVTAGGACLLFFLTVRIAMLRKLRLQRELVSKFIQIHPELELRSGELVEPDELLESLKKSNSAQENIHQSLEIIRQMKFNKLHYNNLIKKAPYNWVAKLSGLQSI